MTEALVTTGAVALAAAGGYQAFGSTINEKITCYGQELSSGQTGCGSGASSTIPPVPADVAQGSQGAQTSQESSVPAGAQPFGASSPAAAVVQPAATFTKLPPDELRTITGYLADPKNDASKGHAVTDTVQGYQGLTTDGTNALLNAVAYVNTKDSKYAQAAADILLDWAKNNQRFGGSNGFLTPAWYVNAMTRAAQLLKDSGAPQWNAIVPGTKQTLGQLYTSWARGVASRYFFPPGATYDDIWKLTGKSVAGRVNRWELQNVTNRTMTALEASMAIARLSGDKAWFDQLVQFYKRFVQPKKDGTSFFTDANGTNTDDSRKDKATWHHQAGIAAAVSIAQMAGTMTDPSTGKPYDLWSLQDNILLKSSEHYAGELLDYAARWDKMTTAQRNQNQDNMPFYIPYYQAVVDHYGASSTPNTSQAYQRSQGWTGVSKYVDSGWGFPQYP